MLEFLKWAESCMLHLCQHYFCLSPTLSTTFVGGPPLILKWGSEMIQIVCASDVYACARIIDIPNVQCEPMTAPTRFDN